MKTLLTTGDVASHCQVTLQTASNWIRSGRLKAFRTPGRHQRIPLAEFERFLADHGMPPYGRSREMGGASGAKAAGSAPEGRGAMPREQSPAGGPDRRRILVVDDDPAIVQMVARYLSRVGGYELATAADGFEAGAQVYGFRPDLVLLDLMMPNLDGFSVCQRIKAAPPTAHIKVLVMTGYASDDNIRAARDRGADDCLTKPFRIEELRRRVDRLLGRAERARAPGG